MDFSLAYMRSNNQILVKSFDDKNDKAKIINIEELKNEEVQGLLIPDNLYLGSTLENLKELEKDFPFRRAEEFNIDAQMFDSLNLFDGKKILKNIYFKWILENNLILIEELFEIILRLKNLVYVDRISFFEEFWFILKNNLGGVDLKVLFNDIKNEQGHKKNSLITLKVEGPQKPNPVDANEEDLFLFSNFKDQLNDQFQIIEYDKKSEKLLAGFVMKQSPVFIYTKIPQLSPIQNSLLKSLVRGLNQEVPIKY